MTRDQYLARIGALSATGLVPRQIAAHGVAADLALASVRDPSLLADVVSPGAVAQILADHPALATAEPGTDVYRRGRLDVLAAVIGTAEGAVTYWIAAELLDTTEISDASERSIRSWLRDRHGRADA